jgi:hypothetical protein
MSACRKSKRVADFDIGHGLRHSARHFVAGRVMLSGMTNACFETWALVFIAGVNSLSIGFGTTLLGACLAYLAGIRTVIRNPPGT